MEKYHVVYALAHLIGFLYVLYTPSLSENIFNGLISCD